MVQQESNIVQALGVSLMHILLDIVECLREEAHAFSFLVQLFLFYCGRILYDIWLHIALGGGVFHDVLELWARHEFEIGIFHHAHLSIDTFVS